MVKSRKNLGDEINNALNHQSIKPSEALNVPNISYQFSSIVVLELPENSTYSKSNNLIFRSPGVFKRERIIG